MARLLWISLGGAAGTAARYLLGGWVMQRSGSVFPFGTLSVNVIGSFLLGAIMEASLLTSLPPPTLRLALTTGFMGGFTTYSTFNYETLRFFQDGAILYGLADILVTVFVCLAAGALGLFAARWAFGA
ncbi:MAG TPA: fluoride efflux transporter CrcB [Thermoanaerobaculia bacterium]|nr:fluoride efflux transporter CrcB [Thermoanaerobaculia bacterium]